MRRVLWTSVAVVGGVVLLAKVRSDVSHRHAPAAARAALGAFAAVTGAATRAAETFRTATAEREAELRADLLAGADLTRSRLRVDAWRTERSAARDAPASASGTVAPGTTAAGTTAAADVRSGTARPGSVAATADAVPVAAIPAAAVPAAAVPAAAVPAAVPPATGPGAGGRRGGAHRAEDPEDGPEGYSF